MQFVNEHVKTQTQSLLLVLNKARKIKSQLLDTKCHQLNLLSYSTCVWNAVIVGNEYDLMSWAQKNMICETIFFEQVHPKIQVNI